MTTEFRCLVLIPDNVPDKNNEVFLRKGISLPETRVPVAFEFKEDFLHHLGSAKLSWGDDGRIYADVSLLFDGPSCILAALTPAIGGSVINADPESRKLSGPPRVLRETVLNRVGFSIECNQDPRIKTLGEQRCFGEHFKDPKNSKLFITAPKNAKALPDIDLDVDARLAKPCRGECGNKHLDLDGICHQTHLLRSDKEEKNDDDN